MLADCEQGIVDRTSGLWSRCRAPQQTRLLSGELASVGSPTRRTGSSTDSPAGMLRMWHEQSPRFQEHVQSKHHDSSDRDNARGVLHQFGGRGRSSRDGDTSVFIQGHSRGRGQYRAGNKQSTVAGDVYECRAGCRPPESRGNSREPATASWRNGG